MIKVYPSTETEFTSNGLGVLRDVISCSVTEERNGAYELKMRYPVTGQHFDALVLRNIILAKPNRKDDPQPFRIYSITKRLNVVVTVHAEHRTYDMSGYIVKPFTAIGINDAFDKILENSTTECQFTFWTDKDVGATMETSVPMTMRALLGGTENSILDVYGKGEYKFDKFNVKLYLNRGANNNVTIRYGKNLTDFEQEENCSEVYTGIYPYWYSEEEGLVQLSTDPIVPAPGTYDFERVLAVDFTQDFEEKPTEELLRLHAEDYVDYYDIGIPKVSLDVSFIELTKSQEYQDVKLLEEIGLCDTINVVFPKMNVNATAKVIATEFDPLTNQYTSLKIGEPKDDLVSATVANNERIQKEFDNTKSRMEQAADHATDLLRGAYGGYKLTRTDNDGKPYETLFMDTPDINTAVHVLRINQNGIGFSSSGYNGPYATAWTLDGNFVADYITSGTFDGSLIKANVIEDQQGKFSLNLETGDVRMEVVDEVRDEVTGLSTTMQSRFEQTERDFTIQISQRDDRIDEANENTDNLRPQLDTVFKFESDGLRISGTEGSAEDSYVKITADSQVFYAGGEESLSLSGNGINTKSVYSQGEISAESVTVRPWKWYVTSGGVLELGKES